MLRTIHLPLVFALILASAAYARRSGPFEGKSWKITVTPDDDSRQGQKAFSDVITFKGNRFASEAFAKRGFAAADYDEDTRGVSTGSFTVEQQSAKEGVLRWSGALTATILRGNIKLTKKDGSTETYSFSGERR